jgi:hypothetical protein
LESRSAVTDAERTPLSIIANSPITAPGPNMARMRSLPFGVSTLALSSPSSTRQHPSPRPPRFHPRQRSSSARSTGRHERVSAWPLISTSRAHVSGSTRSARCGELGLKKGPSICRIVATTSFGSHCAHDHIPLFVGAPGRETAEQLFTGQRQNPIILLLTRTL